MKEIGYYQELLKGEIVANTYNPNSMSDGEQARLDKSMSRYGMLQTILIYKDIDNNYIIIDGEHRWKNADEKEKLRCIVVVDSDLEIIKEQLKQEGIIVNSRTDILKNLTILLNRLKGTMSPMKLGELISNLEVDDAMKANFLLFDQEEINFYSLVDQIEADKATVHQKILNGTEVAEESLRFKVVSIEGLKSVIVDIKNKKLLVDGAPKDIEDIGLTMGKDFKTILRLRYRDIQQSTGIVQPESDKQSE